MTDRFRTTAGSAADAARAAAPAAAAPPARAAATAPVGPGAHTVAVLALPGAIPFDLAIPCDAFGWTIDADGRPAYRVMVCSATGDIDTGPYVVRAPHGIEALAEAETIVVPGVRDPTEPLPQAALTALRDAAARGARVASICSGAFALARAGLLDGRRATTHWKATATLAALHPAVDVDPDALYVDEGPILTSAGAAAGMDLCLHMIRCDFGAAVAAETARAAVMALERPGGQSQFVAHEPPTAAGATLAPLLAWAEAHLADDLSLEVLAGRAHVSPRTLTRRFREQTGSTPLQWVLRARIRRAQQLLETTGDSIEGVARRSGFASPVTFRSRFRRVVGVGPQRYRETFRAGGTGASRAVREP
jgi:transcriptional regulator GlxA family with amidase domain